MSFFEKIVFKTFLILALCCFAVSSAFADTTHKFYTTLDGGGYCNISPDAFTQQTFTWWILNPSVGSTFYRPSYDGSQLNNAELYIRYSKSYYNENTKTWGPPSSQEPVHVGRERTHTCPDNTQFVLDGCNASCVVDPCQAKQGLTFTKEVTCGTVTCINQGLITGTPPNLSCSKGIGIWTPAPAQTTSFEECSGTLLNANIPSQGQLAQTIVPEDALGKSSTTAYCSATYTYTGSTGTSAENPDLVNLSFSGVIPTTEDGQCPAGYKKGSFALGEQDPNNPNNQYICIPDSGSPTDPTDPPPINCATGTHYDAATDKCVPDTNTGGGDNNNGGDSGTGDNNTGGGGGGGGGGGSGGSGSSGGEGQGDEADSNPNDGINSGADGKQSTGKCAAGENCSYTSSTSCQTPPACTGDVLQCGLILEQYKTKCEMVKNFGSVPNDVQTAADGLGEEVTDNQDINSWKGTTKGYTETLRSLAVPSSSSCNISNIQLNILSKTVEIPLAQFCPFFELIRLLLNITVDLVVLRIISKAILSAPV